MKTRLILSSAIALMFAASCSKQSALQPDTFVAPTAYAKQAPVLPAPATSADEIPDLGGPCPPMPIPEDDTLPSGPTPVPLLKAPITPKQPRNFR